MNYERLNLNKNDTWKAEHVKHIEDGIKTIESRISCIKKVALLEQQTIESFVYNSDLGVYFRALTPSPCVLELNKEYIVKYDGTEYTCTSFEFDSGEYTMVAIGNKVLIGEQDTGEPFAITYNAETDYLNIFVMTTDYSHDIAIYHETIVDKLPEITADDNGKVLQVVDGNWDLRTLEVSTTSDRITLVEEQILPFTVENDYSVLEITDSSMVVPIVEGETYIVALDGTEYECVGVLISTDIDGDPLNLYYIGNASIANMGEDTGEPFAFVYILESNGNFAIVSGTETTHTVGIYKLDSSKRLPTVTEEDNGKVLCVVDGKYKLTRLSSTSSGNGSSSSWDVLSNQHGETYTYVTINKTGHEESNVFYNIKTDGNILVTTFFWNEPWLNSITMGETMAEIIIDNNYPLFDKFYNVINDNHYLIGQFNYLSTGGFHFGLTCFCSSTNITFRIVARETKSVAGQLDDNGSSKQVGVLYTNNVF